MYKHQIPSRVRVLVIGGGIHGVGVLHDMSTRGWTDIHLVEKGSLGSGTSSRSTKLVHGGLRYLKRLRDFGLVTEALHERQHLMRLAPDLVQPVEMLFPILKTGGMPGPMIKVGLTLYDTLAGRSCIERHRRLPPHEVSEKASILNQDLVSGVYSFWDAQTDDLALVQRVAGSAVQLGAGITEGCRALSIKPIDDGWTVDVMLADGSRQSISALYVINGAGPWAHELYDRSGIKPRFQGLNNKGSHLMFGDLGLKSALFLQSSRGDGRIFFLLPWAGYTLLGTTEDLYEGDLDGVSVSSGEAEYLLQNVNHFLKTPLSLSAVKGTFAGLRWLAVEPGHSLTETTRSFSLDERVSQRGLLLTIYGGKLTTYRTLARTIGDRISRHFGEKKPSRTDEAAMWAAPGPSSVSSDILDRFTNRGE